MTVHMQAIPMTLGVSVTTNYVALPSDLEREIEERELIAFDEGEAHGYERARQEPSSWRDVVLCLMCLAGAFYAGAVVAVLTMIGFGWAPR